VSASVLSLVGALALAMLHLAAGRLHRGAEVRPAWLTAASGMSVAYVFVHLLPDLAETQARWLEARADRALWWLENQVYLATLLGVIVSLGLARASPRGERRYFWPRLTSFAVYNALIGGFALRYHSVTALLLALVAYGAHFLINDHSLHRTYGRGYERIGRWVLAGSIVVGWLVAVLWRPPVVVVATAVGLIAGGIVLNAIKEELPEREARFAPWVAGAVGYTLLLLALAYTSSVSAR
jgi:hypothetical protein